MLPILESSGATMPSIDWATTFGSLDFSVLLDGVVTMIPIIMPVLLTIYGIKAGYRFAKKSLRGASKF